MLPTAHDMCRIAKHIGDSGDTGLLLSHTFTTPKLAPQNTTALTETPITRQVLAKYSPSTRQVLAKPPPGPPPPAPPFPASPGLPVQPSPPCPRPAPPRPSPPTPPTSFQPSEVSGPSRAPAPLSFLFLVPQPWPERLDLPSNAQQSLICRICSLQRHWWLTSFEESLIARVGSRESC